MNVPSFTRAWRMRYATKAAQAERKALKRQTSKALRANAKAELACLKPNRKVPSAYDVI